MASNRRAVRTVDSNRKKTSQPYGRFSLAAASSILCFFSEMQMMVTRTTNCATMPMSGQRTDSLSAHCVKKTTSGVAELFSSHF
ncbi:hypothetical protein BaRGS_00021955 [Batillaria attramentaria]|uniref:Uncharacterized protein n=1 Tax=Batillaria attramentaria TaxID=370345 RepID=A0ABD0KIA8_9CAEN